MAIPTITLDAHLDTAVDSVLRQTVSDVEVLVALDGLFDSGDRRPWMDDPRVLVTSSSRRLGTARTLNAVLGSTTAPVCARLDADDVAEPDRLEQQLEALDRHAKWIGVGSDATVIDETGRSLGHIEVPSDDTARMLLERNVLVHSAMVLRREPLERVGGYDPRCIRMQDYDLWLRLSTVGTLGNVREPLVRYRVHQGMRSRNTPAFSESARTVLAARRRLARHLRAPIPLQYLDDLVSTAGQSLRSLGLRRPRHLTTS